MERILLLSGVDPTGEAGLILDTVIAFNSSVSASGAPTALVAENAYAVNQVHNVEPDAFISLVLSVLEEGPVKATKIGLLPDTLAEPLLELFLNRREDFGRVVLDPVIGSTTGYSFHTSVSPAYEDLMRLSDLITPNLEEAKFITGSAFKDPHGYGALYEAFLKLQIKNVLVTGIPVNSEKIRDVLFLEGREYFYEHFLIPKKVRGTGCALSTYIACQLAQGAGMKMAVEKAIEAVQKWINSSIPVSNGDTFMIYPG